MFSFIFSVTTFAGISEAAEFKFLVLKAAENYEETVDLSNLNLTQTEISKYLSEIFAKENVWYLDCQYLPVDDNTDGIVEEIRLYYRVPHEEIDENEILIQNILDSIVNLTEGYTNPEKIKIVYDYFISNYDYDWNFENNDIYRLFDTKQGTCAALSLAYKAVLDELDIPCEIVINTDMSHEWNRVFVDNEWKYIDITKGLLLKNTIPNAEYRAFLQSNEVLKAWGYKF